MRLNNALKNILYFHWQIVSKSQSAPNLLSGDSQYDNWSNPYAKLALVCRICSKEQNPKTRNTWKQHWESHTDLKNFGCYICEKRFRMKGNCIFRQEKFSSMNQFRVGKLLTGKFSHFFHFFLTKLCGKCFIGE